MSGANEGKRNHVDSDLDKGIEKTKIFGSRGRDTQTVGRNMNTGPSGEMSAVIHADPKMVALSTQSEHLHRSIAEYQVVAFLDVGQ
ncbi:unannotated protein [freshwater metagenome]|uniref:Unannotated protein n=1 Tax=freshwater metagenome TaxID=449393 RepID=A0A6J6AP75_9ZZZZ